MDLKLKRRALKANPSKERNFQSCEIFDDSMTYMKSGLSEHGILAARGILICLVVIGHISGGGSSFFHLKEFIYDFHIMAFFMISMLRPVPNLSLHSLKAVAYRYLKMLLPVSMVSFLIFNFGVLGLDLLETIQRTPVYLIAIFGGNYTSFDSSTGLELFWFMYALIGLIYLRMALKLLPSRRYTTPAFLVACLVIGSICSIFFTTTSPSWFGISTYVLPVLCLTIFLMDAISSLEKVNEKLFLSIFTIIILIVGIVWVPENSFNVAWLRIPLPWDLPEFFIWIIFLALVFRVLIAFSSLKFTQVVFLKIGRLSLGIYLTHMFFLFPIDSFLMDQIEFDFIRIALVFTSTITISALTASILSRL